MAKKGVYCLDIRIGTSDVEMLVPDLVDFLNNFMTFCQTDCNFAFPQIPVVLISDEEMKKYDEEETSRIIEICRRENEPPPDPLHCLGFYSSHGYPSLFKIKPAAIITIRGPVVVICSERIFAAAQGAPFDGRADLCFSEVVLHEFGHAIMDRDMSSAPHPADHDLFYEWMEESMANVIVLTCFKARDARFPQGTPLAIVRKSIAKAPENYKFALDLFKYGIFHWWTWHAYKRDSRGPLVTRDVRQWWHFNVYNIDGIGPEVERGLDAWRNVPENADITLGPRQIWRILARAIMKQQQAPADLAAMSYLLKSLLSTVLQKPLYDGVAFERFPLGGGLGVYHDMPEHIMEIGPGAFRDCSSLTQITIPAGVKKIGCNAFEGCWALEQIYFKGGVSLAANIFKNSSRVVVYYCSGRKDWKSKFCRRPTKEWPECGRPSGDIS
jgi:hypothetical protein